MSEFFDLRKIISREKRILREIDSASKNLKKVSDSDEKSMFETQIKALQKSLDESNENILDIVSKINLSQPLQMPQKIEIKKEIIPENSKKISVKNSKNNIKTSQFEKDTIKRIKQKENSAGVKKEIKPSKYIEISNKYFSDISGNLIAKEKFSHLKMDLIKSNLQILPKSYLSVILFTTVLSFIASFILFIFLLFFSVSATLPFIAFFSGSILSRIGTTFWIILVIPLLTFLMMYVYPSMEKRSQEARINQELPFAAINMASVAGSMIDPTRIFEIIITTKEYPYIEKEFTKLLNETNILGYDLVTALRNRAFNSPSKKLAELFNGLATTINSGGNLVEFFEKRSQTLLFDYKLEREKYTRSAETFMDIYISVVIAAPMIFMLLLIMIKISGLGISLSTGMITLIMILGVSVINLAFLTFLHLRQPVE